MPIVFKIDHGTDDLHAVVMALKLSKMILDQKQDVTLFLNLEGVRIADKKQPMGLKWGASDKTVEELYNDFVTAGGQVLVCPHCAHVAGLSKQDLRKGAKIAEEKEVADLFVKADKVIDY
jgi:predicted peroxiredoxin